MSQLRNVVKAAVSCPRCWEGVLRCIPPPSASGLPDTPVSLVSPCPLLARTFSFLTASF